MSFMLLIHEPVGQRATRTEAEGRALYDRMLRFGDELAGEGVPMPPSRTPVFRFPVVPVTPALLVPTPDNSS